MAAVQFEDTVSYSAKVVRLSESVNRLLWKTKNFYNDALMYLIGVAEAEWDTLSKCSTANDQKNTFEHLYHKTKTNDPAYPFDDDFPLFPCYLRRDCAAKALGHVSSYVSNTSNYAAMQKERMDNGMRPKKRRPPKFNPEPAITPYFYKGNMYIPDKGEAVILLKLFDGKTWKYYPLEIASKDVRYIRKKQADGWKTCSPGLRRQFGHWVIVYTFQKRKKSLPDTDGISTVMGVDLGVTNDAVCSVLTTDGTVTAREFIRLAGEKDRLNHLLNRKRRIRSESGRYASLSHINTKILGIQDNIENQVAHRIVHTAVACRADVVVFEHLAPNFRGKSSEKVHHWRKMAIIHKACAMLHREGIRWATVSPRNTSRLAFDGSGRTVRGKEINSDIPYDICRFKTGKMYNCDLNASYNIAARYLMRLVKSTHESEWSHVTAKVPCAAKRTRITLATYLDVLKVLRESQG